MIKRGEASLTIQDPYIVTVAQALLNLSPQWRTRVERGQIKLPFAVQLGAKLDREQQHGMLNFVEDAEVPEAMLGKVLHSFASGLPEWAAGHVLQIYKWADKTKASIVMFNDLMDEFEALFYRFEYQFLEGGLPEREEELEESLLFTLEQLQALYHRAPARERTAHNRTYGDSSSQSDRPGSGRAGEAFFSAGNKKAEFAVLIGVPEQASHEEIRKQYRRLLKKLHPDHGGSGFLFDWVKKAADAYEANKKASPSDP